MNYMDRFLALTPIPRTQLQMLASACLLIASKLREPSVRGLPAEILVFYTDNSVTRRDLIVSKYTNVKYFRAICLRINKHAINHLIISPRQWKYEQKHKEHNLPIKKNGKLLNTAMASIILAS